VIVRGFTDDQLDALFGQSRERSGLFFKCAPIWWFGVDLAVEPLHYFSIRRVGGAGSPGGCEAGNSGL
jgi:hypothetical protein